ncbi:carboxypeptidase-like regulatory domain-containing protein [Virgisporangium aurantiacum]|uniref:carboxypeptidase-like regulatory domain-containing protein n=1 Tax=Virgisporangium aurantiacum TaxID=175570 RepID=UPI00195110D0|nr:carboxypeptidase-like regulatory domain-containing protein [Virgisporangium aurantiacum]
MLASVAAVVAVVAGGATPASAAAVSLTGTVVDTTTGAPLAACVTLVGESGAVIDGGCTDADGRYSVLDVPQAPYKVKATAPGYADQWAHNKSSAETADALFLWSYMTTTANFRLYHAPGVISGQITTASGAAFAGAQVRAVPDPSTAMYSGIPGFTDANGNYSITVPPGRYRLSFWHSAYEYRWAQGQTDAALATVYDVADGGAVRVDDHFGPTGAVEVTMVDATSGAPVLRGCARVPPGAPSSVCTTTGVIRIEDVQPGQTTVEVRPDVTHQPKYVGVTVVAEETTAVTVPLQGARSVVTSAVDAKTGAPLAGVCVRAAVPGSPVSQGNPVACSEADGRLAWRIEGPFLAPTFDLLASTADNSYGTQWVGETGGTGDRRRARTVVTSADGAVVLPPIRMDRPGTIAGKVTAKGTGTPVAGVCAHPYATVRGSAPDSGANCTDAQGRYEIRGLGPYQWPVEFAAPAPYALQWSGGASNRIDADHVKVRAGRTATENARLLPGATLAGQVNAATGTPTYGSVTVYNARSGDVLATVTSDFNGQTSAIAGLAPQQVKIRVAIPGAPGPCWYDRQSTFETATRFPIPPGSTQTVTLTACA